MKDQRGFAVIELAHVLVFGAICAVVGGWVLFVAIPWIWEKLT